MTPQTPISAPAGTAPPPPRSSSLARLGGVFVSPAQTFEELAADPHFILCWCVQIVVSLAYFVLLMQRVGVYALARQAIMASPQAAAMDPAQQQKLIATSAVFMKISFYAAPLLTIIALLVMAAIFLGLANLVLGYEAKFKQALAVVSYGYLANTLMFVVVIVVMLAGGAASGFDLKNPLTGSNLAFLLDKNTTGAFLYNLALHIDIFSIWTAALLGIGLAKLGFKKGRVGSALGIVFSLWVLWILATSGLAAL